MGVIDTVKEKLNIGQCHDPEHHHPEQTGRQTGHQTGMVRGTTGATSNTKTETMPGQTRTATTTTTRTGHAQNCHTKDCPGCEDNWHAQGKHVPWEDAQSKIGEAQQAAKISEVNACKATKELESISMMQQESESSKTRLAELERELAGMRNSGVDLRAKQAEVEAAKRRAAELQERIMEAERRAREHEGLVGEKERRAQEAHGVLRDHAKGMQPLEQELADIQRAKAEAEQRYTHHHKALTEFEGTHQPKEAEIQRLRQELENHARAKKEAEAALAAVEMRHRDTHGKLGHAQSDYDASLKHREGLHHHHQSAKKYLDDLTAREAALRQQLGERRGLVGQHETAAQRAAQEAEAMRARAQEHRGALNPLQQKLAEQTDAVRSAEAGLGDAAMQQRREREREATLARELEGHRRTTDTTTTETQRRVGDYEKYKAKAHEANQHKEELFEEAKHLGGVGDRNADSHLRQLEKRLEGVDIGSLKNTTTRTTNTVTREE